MIECRSNTLADHPDPTEKYVLALRCLQAAIALDPEAPKVHEQKIAFRSLLNSSPELPAKVAELLNADFKAIDASADLKKVNEEYLAKHQSSPRHVLSVIRARRALGADIAQCEKDLTGILDLKDVSFEDAIAVSETLRGWHSGQLAAFKTAARGKWPEVTRLA